MVRIKEGLKLGRMLGLKVGSLVGRLVGSLERVVVGFRVTAKEG